FSFIVLDGALALKIGVLVFLLICSALISGAEVAFFGLSGTEINDLEQKNTSTGNITVKLLEKPKKLLATILISNNAINIGVVLLFSSIGDTIFSGITQYWFGVVPVRFLLE